VVEKRKQRLHGQKQKFEQGGFGVTEKWRKELVGVKVLEEKGGGIYRGQKRKEKETCRKRS